MYSQKVMEHFKNPKNMGKMEKADAVGEVGNPQCGDILKVYIKVENSKIKNISVETMGCVAAIATSSMVTELAKGRTIKEAKEITFNDIADELGSLPPIKNHCAHLAADALKKAIDNYEQKNK